MSHLIYLRQRINAIETIQQTTNAMRLISISSHARLRQKKTHLERYQQEIKQFAHVLRDVRPVVATNSDDLAAPQQKTLVLIIGSQKGLCGTFNNNLITFIGKDGLLHMTTPDIIVIGRHMVDYAHKVVGSRSFKRFDDFTIANFVELSAQLTALIEAEKYTDVYAYSNHPKTFFLQMCQKTRILPFDHPQDTDIFSGDVKPDYKYEAEDLDALQEYIYKLTLGVSLQNVLFESLLAEQAARFISMDAATRNAEDVLNAMKLDYNKLRQALITRELTDLVSGL
ncbi:MAG: FoF1 ATP synthase subunit gamma [Candidatus Babeliaceae bacterium]|jgi:F-type H+-transporting ATPase subunit gamma